LKLYPSCIKRKVRVEDNRVPNGMVCNVV